MQPLPPMWVIAVIVEAGIAGIALTVAVDWISMAQWTVEGADKNTGKDTSLLVEAPNADAARLVASKQGLVVAEIHPSEQHATIEAAQLSYRSIPMARTAPSSRLIRWAILMLNGIAVAAYVLALGEAGSNVYQSATRTNMISFSGWSLIGSIAAGLFAAVKTCAFGVIFQTAAALLQLLSDYVTSRRA